MNIVKCDVDAHADQSAEAPGHTTDHPGRIRQSKRPDVPGDSPALMIESWLKTALQEASRRPHYAGARTRYGLTATRARPQTARTRRRGAGRRARDKAEGRDDRLPVRASRVLPAIDADRYAARHRRPSRAGWTDSAH